MRSIQRSIYFMETCIAAMEASFANMELFFSANEARTFRHETSIAGKETSIAAMELSIAAMDSSVIPMEFPIRAIASSIVFMECSTATMGRRCFDRGSSIAARDVSLRNLEGGIPFIERRRRFVLRSCPAMERRDSWPGVQWGGMEGSRKPCLRWPGHGSGAWN